MTSNASLQKSVCTFLYPIFLKWPPPDPCYVTISLLRISPGRYYGDPQFRSAVVLRHYTAYRIWGYFSLTRVIASESGTQIMHSSCGVLYPVSTVRHYTKTHDSGTASSHVCFPPSSPSLPRPHSLELWPSYSPLIAQHSLTCVKCRGKQKRCAVEQMISNNVDQLTNSVQIRFVTPGNFSCATTSPRLFLIFLPFPLPHAYLYEYIWE